MIVFDGQPALSPFRLERLNSELERVHSGGRISGARHVYFVAADGSEQALDQARHERRFQNRFCMTMRMNRNMGRLFVEPQRVSFAG